MKTAAAHVAKFPSCRSQTLAYLIASEKTHDELRKAFALTVMEREIERIVRAEVALEYGGLA